MDTKITNVAEESVPQQDSEKLAPVESSSCVTATDSIVTDGAPENTKNDDAEQREASTAPKESLIAPQTSAKVQDIRENGPPGDTLIKNDSTESSLTAETNNNNIEEEKHIVDEPKSNKKDDVTEIVEPEIPTLPLPDPISEFRGHISAFGFSQQGESHINKSVPCQDRSSLRFLTDTVMVAAIADGVGSCALSDYGSDTAIKASLDFLEKYLGKKLEDPTFSLDVKLMGKLLREMMQYAYDQVKMKAEEMEQLLYSMQSTLTVAVYDGKTLYFAHAGDDGIVALTRQGKCEMVTTRHKGEEASSVYPLQSCNTWQYGMVDDAVGFIMATDGVLDAFVRNESEGNRVYYPFIEPAFSTPLTNAEDTVAACNDWFAYMKTPNYRATVTDDLSFICVVNQETLKCSVKPVFDMEDWKKKTKEYESRRRAALYPPKEQEKATKSEVKKSSPIQSPNNRACESPQKVISRTPPVSQDRPKQVDGRIQNKPRVPQPMSKVTQTPPAPRNAPYYRDKDSLSDLREYSLKAVEGLGGMLVLGSEILVDLAEDAVLLMRGYVSDVKDNRNSTRKPTNPTYPKGRKDNGEGNNANGK